MPFDPHKNFAYGVVSVAPSPAGSGTSLQVQTGQGADFPAASSGDSTTHYNLTVWPTDALPLSSNAEIVRVTNRSGDVFTITRTQESSSARSIVVGDQVAATITNKTLTDIEGTFAGLLSGIAGSNTTYTSGTVTFTGVGGGVTVSSNTGQRIDISVAAPVAQTVQTQNLHNVTLAGNTAGALAHISSGTMTLAGGNNITLSQNGNAITISGANTAAQTGISGVVASDATYTSGTVSFTGVGGGVTVRSNTGQRIDISVAAQTVQTQNMIAASLSGNTAGALALISSGTAIFAGGNNITLSQDGQSITISGANVGGAQTGISGIVVSDATYTSGTVSFSNAGNITIASSVNGATQYIRLSGNAAQTAQSAIEGFGVSNTGATAGNTGISTGVDWVLAGSQSITLSQSTAAGTNTVWIQHPAWLTTAMQSNAVTLSNIRVSAGTTSNLLSAITFADSNGIAFGINASTVTASYTVPTVTNSSWTVSDNGTSGTVARLAFTNQNGVTLSLSTGANGSHTIVGSHNAITSQSTQFLALTLGGNTAGTTTFHATNNASLFLNGGNNVTLSGNGSTVTISAAAQTNQTLGLYAVGNTTGESSSTTRDARTLSFHGAGNVSVGYSAGSVIVSGGSAAASPVNFSAGTTSNNLATVVFSDSNGVSFGLNGSTITATVSTYNTAGTATTVTPVASANSVGTVTRWAAEDHRHAGIGGVGISTAGNTSGTTGSQVGTYWFQGGSNITLSQITSDNGSHTLVVSAPTPVTLSQWPDILPGSTAVSTYYSGSTSQGGGGNSTLSGYTFSLYAVPLVLPAAVAFSEMRIGVSNNTNAGTGSVTHMYSVGIYTNNANTLSRVTAYYGGMVLSQNSQTAQTFSVFTATTAGATSGAGGGMAGISKHSVYSSQGNVSANSQLYGRLQFIRVDSGAASTLTGGQYWVVFANATASSGANVMSQVGVLQSNAILSVNIPDVGRENSTQSSNYLPAWGAISTTFTSASNAASFFAMPVAIDMANMSRSSSAWHRFHFPVMRNLS